MSSLFTAADPGFGVIKVSLLPSDAAFSLALNWRAFLSVVHTDHATVIPKTEI